MKIIYNGEELNLQPTQRMWFIYENVTNETFDATKDSYTNSTTLIYAAIKAAIQRKNIKEHLDINENIALNDVLEFIDDNGGLMFTARFSKWLEEEVTKQAEAIRHMDDIKAPEEDDSTTKKK